MMTDLSSASARPVPGQLMREDFKPGLRFVKHMLDYPDHLVTYVVVSEVVPIDEVWVVTPEQADRFTEEEIQSCKLEGLGQLLSLERLGVIPLLRDSSQWNMFYWCTRAKD